MKHATFQWFYVWQSVCLSMTISRWFSGFTTCISKLILFSNRYTYGWLFSCFAYCQKSNETTVIKSAGIFMFKLISVLKIIYTKTNCCTGNQWIIHCGHKKITFNVDNCEPPHKLKWLQSQGSYLNCQS